MKYAILVLEMPNVYVKQDSDHILEKVVLINCVLMIALTEEHVLTDCANVMMDTLGLIV